jgi:hypothetical protein
MCRTGRCGPGRCARSAGRASSDRRRPCRR